MCVRGVFTTSITTDNWVSLFFSRPLFSGTIPRALRRWCSGPPLLSTRPTCNVPKHTHIYGVCWMRHISSTHCPLVKVRPSSDNPYRGVISHRSPEYQYPWFQFYRAFKFYLVSPEGGPCIKWRGKKETPSCPWWNPPLKPRHFGNVVITMLYGV